MPLVFRDDRAAVYARKSEERDRMVSFLEGVSIAANRVARGDPLDILTPEAVDAAKYMIERDFVSRLERFRGRPGTAPDGR